MRWHYCNSKWEARIFNGTRQVSLGYFDNEVEAATAYDAQAWKMRGAAAVLNFPANGDKSPQEPETKVSLVHSPSEANPADAKAASQTEGKAELIPNGDMAEYFVKMLKEESGVNVH